jgi:hypothetical protein
MRLFRASDDLALGSDNYRITGIDSGLAYAYARAATTSPPMPRGLWPQAKAIALARGKPGPDGISRRGAGHPPQCLT